MWCALNRTIGPSTCCEAMAEGGAREMSKRRRKKKEELQEEGERNCSTLDY